MDGYIKLGRHGICLGAGTNSWLRAAALLLLLLGGLSGCRRNPFMDTYVEAMNAEYRALEDRYYDLQFDYEAKLAELESLRRRQGQPTREAADSPRPGARRDSDSDSPDFRPPDVDPGFPVPPESPDPAAAQRPAAPDTSRITQLDFTISPSPDSPTPGESFGEALGLIVEPRNSAGRLVPEPGRITVVVVDPRQQGDAARVARWDVTPDQAASGLDRSPGGGIQLWLRWPATQPRRDPLRVFVRYETPDGRRLEADRELNPNESAEVTRSWTPRSPRTASTAPRLPENLVEPLAAPPEPMPAQAPVAARPWSPFR
ncbi:MAG: hypothetical protein J5I93_02945 [Pirellulaceae bacterium]|nr:hypothetical protein [Pirellulaceae bacterium]